LTAAPSTPPLEPTGVAGVAPHACGAPFPLAGGVGMIGQGVSLL